MYKGTFLEYLVDRMDISTVKEHYAEFSNGGDFTAYVKELKASRESQSAVPSEGEIDIAEDAWYLLTCAKDNLLPGQYEQYEKKIQSILKRGIAG